MGSYAPARSSGHKALAIEKQDVSVSARFDRDGSTQATQCAFIDISRQFKYTAGHIGLPQVSGRLERGVAGGGRVRTGLEML